MSQPNEILLLEARLNASRAETYPESSVNEFFLMSSIDTVLRRRQLSYQQIEEGITEGSNDGGIDAVYTFMNGSLVEDDSTAAHDRPQIAAHDRPRIELEIIQVKNERGFAEVALQRLLDHLPKLLQLEPSDSLHIEFNDRLLERFNIFRTIYLRASRYFPELTVRIRYITKSVDLPNAKVRAKATRLKTSICECFSNADASIEFIGPNDLNSRSRERLNAVLEVRISEGPISADKGGLACLVSLSDWYRFIVDKADGELREDIFEENVRGYEGATVINRGIAESLRKGDTSSADFWWLNNGVTVLGSRVQASGKKLVIDDPQIVNGLQTSRSIYQYFAGDVDPDIEGGGRHLLVRVIEAQDDTLASQIIKATNSQNRVSIASLRAAEPFQRDIEDYFSRQGYYYERKKNQYKSMGKSRAQIVEVLELAQAVAAIVLCEPHTARGRPSALVRDPLYQKVFDSKTPLAAFLNSVLIVRKIDEYLEAAEVDLNRQERGNVRYQLVRAATAFALLSSRPRPAMVARVDPEAFDVVHVARVHEWVIIARRAAERVTGTKDLNVLAKGAEWSREIDRRLSRYTDKTRWPKRLTGDWSATH